MSWIHDRPASNRDGFALPAAIFALMVVAILVTSGFFLANQEHRIGQSSERTAEVFRMAESGLNTALALWTPSQGDVSVWSDDGHQPIMTDQEGDGEWRVTITRVDDQLYFLESTATITEGGYLAGASRTVGQLARRGRLNITEPNAAVTTQDQLQASGNATLDGRDTNGGGSDWFLQQNDACPPASGGRPAVLMNEGANFDQGGNADVLAPPGVDPVAFDDDVTAETLSIFSDENWEQLRSMATISISDQSNHRIRPTMTPDGQCNTADQFNWGAPLEVNGADSDAAEACQNYFPLVYVRVPSGQQNFQINANSMGQGVLMVDGNLHVNGDFNWAGPIFVRGEFSNNGGTGMYGGVVSLGAEITSDTEQTVSGNAEVTYSSCAVSRAVTGISGNLPLRPLANRAWGDLSASAF
jgi:hypothetical protein